MIQNDTVYQPIKQGMIGLPVAPRNLKVLPLKHQYIPGDSLRVDADAGPPASSYRWLELPSKRPVSTGRTMPITAEMVDRRVSVLVEVQNEINGTKHTTGVVIAFSVKGTR